MNSDIDEFYRDVFEADPVLAATRTQEARRNFWNHHSFMYLQDMIDRAQMEARDQFIANEFGDTTNSITGDG
jgi:hypothetical protein